MTFELWWVAKVGRPPAGTDEADLIAMCREAYMQGRVDQVKETNELLEEHSQKLRALKDAT